MEDYDMLSQIGEGAQGIVFRVLHRTTQQECALKIIECKDQDQVNFALKEIKVLLQLRNPHIVSYIDFFVQLNHGTGDRSSLSVCLVMELCHHENLQDRIKRAKQDFMEMGTHPHSERDVITWLTQATEALQYIHERGFLHRDMKPTNVFFSGHGNVKLGDFGLATSAGLGRESAVGTPHYFAPELLLKLPYNNKVDVWGLAVVFLELLTLRERPINSQVLENPLETETVVSDVVSMGFSRQLGTLLRDMLCRQPDGRPTTAAILQRLSKFTHHNKAAAQQVVAPAAQSLCQLCEVDPSVLKCAECSAFYCAPCDATRHKHPGRRYHLRLNMSTILPPPSPNSHLSEVRVPSALCPTIAAALEMASSSSTLKLILIEPGAVLRSNPLLLTSTVPDGLVIEGLGEPSPVIEFISGGACMVLDTFAGCGRLKNVVLSQIGVDCCLESQSRTCALEIRSGSWVISGCGFSSDVGFGTVISGSSTNPVFEGCRFQNVKQAGALFTDCAIGTLTDCKFTACEHAGILVKKLSAPAVTNCIISCGRETGIYCHESSPRLEGNVVQSNSGCGIVVKGSAASPQISFCKIRDNLQAGIFCSDNSTPRISCNEIIGSRKAGVIVKTGSHPHLHKNVINGGKEAGVYVFESGRGQFTENTITNNANAGVLVTSQGTPECTANIIRRNGYEGIWVCKGGQGIFIDNDVRSNTRGSKDIDHGCTVQWRSNHED